MILCEASLVVGDGAARLTAHAPSEALLAALSRVGFPTAGADGAILASLFDGLSNRVGGMSAGLAVAADFEEFTTPNSIVTVAAADEGVSNFVEDRVSSRLFIVGGHDDAREADKASRVVASSGVLCCATKVDGPILKPVLIHEGAGEFGDLSGVHGTMLTPATTVVNC